MELELILTELQPFELSRLRQLYALMILSHLLVVKILKMCMWLFDGARINFDRITAF